MDMQSPDADAAGQDSPLSRIFLRCLLRTLHATLPMTDRTGKEIAADMWEAARELFFSMQPNTPIEAALAVRAVAAQFASMDMYARAAQPGVTDEKALRLRNSAIAASRSFDSAVRSMEKRQAIPAAGTIPWQAAPAPNRPQPALPAERHGAVDRPATTDKAPPGGWRARLAGRPTVIPGA